MFSEIVPMQKEDLKFLLSQEMNKDDRAGFSDGFIERLDCRHFVTLKYKNKIMACGGITQYWAGRGEVWAMFSEESKNYFVATFRMMKWWLHQQLKSNYRRIEVSIVPELEGARRRAEMLGFKLETPLARCYLPSGEDVCIYTMVRR